MTLKAENLNEIHNFLKHRKYRPTTISAYVSALDNLFSFYENVKPEKIDFDQLTDFTHYLLRRKKLSNSTVRINLSAFDLFYNVLHHNKFDIKSLKPAHSSRKIPEFLTPHEVKQLLQTLTQNTIQYVIISLMYSAGIGLSQVINLRIEDVDCTKKTIKIRDSNRNIIRTAILANHLVNKQQFPDRA